MSDIIYLFTSNSQPQYARDAEAVAGLPTGSRVQFRYNERYVQASLRAAWQSGQLGGREAVVVFSVQHRYFFHPAVLLPVRQVQLQRTWVEGSQYLIEFTLRRYAPIEGGFESDDDRGANVRRFNEELTNLLGEHHPDRETSVAEAAPVYGTWPSFDTVVGSTARDWEIVATTLARSDVFRGHRFFRISAVQSLDGSYLEQEDGRFHLIAGRTYRIQVAHYQIDDVATVEWLVVTSDDDQIDIVSSSRIPIASRYDSTSVLIRAKDASQSALTKVVVSPESPDAGPSLEIVVEVDPPQGKRLLATGASAAGGFLLAAPGLFKEIDPTPWGLVLAGGGMLILGCLAWFGLSPFKLP